MSTGEHDPESPVGTTDTVAEEATPAAEAKVKLGLEVEISDVGPCKKHVKVAISRDDVNRQFADSLKTMSKDAFVPGFRPGHAPRAIIERRYKKEVAGQVKSSLLMAALEQLDEDYKIDPITTPQLDVEAIALPDEGPMRFEIEVEVRPDFALPEYKDLTVQKPARTITEADVDSALIAFREQYGQQVPKLDGAAEIGDFVTAEITFTQDGQVRNVVPETQFRLQPEMRFADGVIANLGEALVGAQPGETRVADAKIGSSSPDPSLRGATLQASFLVQDLKCYRLPEVDKPFLQSFGFEDINDLRDGLREMLERRVATQIRQAVRGQIMDQLTKQVPFDLPADLVANRESITVRRLVDELREGGLKDTQIRAREAEIRSNAHETTLRSLKEFFILGKIAEAEQIKVLDEDIEDEILTIALRRDENPRRVRARIEKEGQSETLITQILERKVLDHILKFVQFEAVALAEESEVETLDQSATTAADVEPEPEPVADAAVETVATEGEPSTD